MCSLLSKKLQQPDMNSQVVEKKKVEDEEGEGAGGGVSSHLYLKPTHTTGTLDKAVVLRRIRHRRRVNRLKSAVRSLVSSPASAADGNENPVPQIRWVDDAFAAP